MALAKLDYEIGADLSKFDLSINEVNSLLRKFTKQANEAGRDGIGPLNAEIDKLIKYREKLQSIGLPEDLPDKTRQSRIALTDLSRVVQDLPFGFIAIQNNIPALVQSFGTLRKENGGLIGGLKELAGSLIGPAGAFFAFSTVTSLITVAIREYGSFGKALDALIGSQSTYNKELKDAIKSYQEFTEARRTNIEISSEEKASVGDNVQTVKTLVNIINDQTQSYENRNTALNKLKSIDKEFFGNLDLEKTKFNDLNEAVKAYISSIEQAAITKGYEQAITDTSTELAKQQIILNKLGKERDDISRKPVKFIGKADIVDTREYDAALARFNEQKKVVEELKQTLTGFNTELDKSVRKQIEIKAPIDAANDALKKQQEQDDKNEKSRKERIRLAKINADKQLEILNDRFKREDNAFKVLRDAYVSTLSDREQELYKIQEDYEEKRSTLLRANIFDFASIEEEKRIRIKEVNDKFDEIALKDAEKLKKERLKIQEDEGKAARAIFESTFVKLKGLSDQEEENKRLQENFIRTGRIIYSNIINPLNELFDVILTKGEKSWEDFTKNVVESLKKLYAKLAATAAVAAIISLASGGASTAGGLSFGAAFKQLLGIKIGGGVANPGFGGVQPGGINMGGQVNLVLRGQDLVGSLNRTNSQFSRVG